MIHSKFINYYLFPGVYAYVAVCHIFVLSGPKQYNMKSFLNAFPGWPTALFFYFVLKWLNVSLI